MAQWWKAVKHSSDQDALFTDLEKSLSDPDKQNRYEAAFFLTSSTIRAWRRRWLNPD